LSNINFKMPISFFQHAHTAEDTKIAVKRAEIILNLAQDKPNTVVQTRHRRKQHQENVAHDTECLNFRRDSIRSVNQKRPEVDGKFIIAG